MSDRAPVKGLVLSGGQSRRMGSDKALLSRGGTTQLEHAMQLLSACVGDAWVSVRPQQADEPERAKFPQIIDAYADLGPVAGILSAMDRDPRAAWLVLACDLPNVSNETLALLLEQRDADRPFTAYRSSENDLPEPLCAIYEPAARAIIDDFVARDIRCPRKMMIRSDAKLLTQPDPASLANVNTPADLRGSSLKAAS